MNKKTFRNNMSKENKKFKESIKNYKRLSELAQVMECGEVKSFVPGSSGNASVQNVADVVVVMEQGQENDVEATEEVVEGIAAVNTISEIGNAQPETFPKRQFEDHLFDQPSSSIPLKKRQLDNVADRRIEDVLDKLESNQEEMLKRLDTLIQMVMGLNQRIAEIENNMIVKH